MSITVPVGYQTYTSTNWEVLIIDCIPKITWNLASDYLLQVGKGPLYVENWAILNEMTNNYAYSTAESTSGSCLGVVRYGHAGTN